MLKHFLSTAGPAAVGGFTHQSAYFVALQFLYFGLAPESVDVAHTEAYVLDRIQLLPHVRGQEAPLLVPSVEEMLGELPFLLCFHFLDLSLSLGHFGSRCGSHLIAEELVEPDHGFHPGHIRQFLDFEKDSPLGSEFSQTEHGLHFSLGNLSG